ncbi:MAG: lamin tail domain-containing protein [Deltaproteobacteria bacterium]|nr:lamin tail domain-containing protein [Deltaproteobacteria bacterium]
MADERVMGKYVFILWAAAAACGCLDLNLLDEVRAASGDGGEGTDSSSGGSGPPATDADDESPPAVSAASCAPAERALAQACVAKGPASASMRFVTDEPARVAASAPNGTRAGVISAEWATEPHVAVSGLAAGSKVEISIAVTDVNGNEATLALEVEAAGGPAVVVTEVLADPLGPEPAQELVEIANVGGEPVDLGGWTLADGAGGDAIPEGTVLGPRQVALLVPEDYDPSAGQDPMPPASALLVRLAGSLGGNGLMNGEAEPVELRDGTGAVASAYRGECGKPKPGLSAARVLADLPEGDPMAWPAAPSSPTPGVAPMLP